MMAVMHMCDRCDAQMRGPGQKMWDTEGGERELCAGCVEWLKQFLKNRRDQ
jgi:hypothetical protein